MSTTIDPADDDSGMYVAPADIYELPTFTASGDQAWRADAACKGEEVAAFFPGRGQNGNVAAAKAVCNGCNVRQECLTEALSDPTISGIWGGTSHRQRRNMRSEANPVESIRHRKDIVHGTNAGYAAHHRRLDDPGPCTPCIEAHSAYRNAAKAARRRTAKAARTLTTTHTDKAAA